MELIKDVLDIRRNYPALEQSVNGKPLVYFDNGATSQKPRSVIELVNRMNSGINGNIHRAVHELSARSTEIYENSREEIRKFINAGSREEIIFTSGTTASVNLVANSFSQAFIGKGDAVLITEGEHHSNIVPWQMACERQGAELRVLPIDDYGCWRMEQLDSLLIDGKVKIASVAHVSNVLGVVNPVSTLIEICHKAGVPVLLDGAQGIIHLNVDVQKLDCDFYVFSGHKLFGPTGIGILYGKKDFLNAIPPWMGGGDMVGRVSFEKTTYAELPLKFEAGTPNFIGAAGLGEAIRFINNIDSEFVKEHERQLVERMMNGLSSVGSLIIYGTSDSKVPLFSFNVPGIHPTDMAMLMDKMGIALRSGMMCSEPLMDHFGVSGMLRASLTIYNTLEEVDYFIESLQKAIRMLS
jgi:cysteine desulfurase/selenocysteine lyase